MKWTVALLLLANAALYLWVGERAGHRWQVPLAQPEVNHEGMLLLHELAGTGRPVASAAPAAKTPAPPPPEKTRQPGVAPTAVAPVDISCYRIGPFKKNAGWLIASRWMKFQRFDYRAVRSQSREMRAVRVFLGPFDSHAAARPVMNWLDDRGIGHFTDPGEHGQVRISLGYFIQEALAVKFVAHLLSQGIEASSRLEYRAMGPFDWMEASINTARHTALLSHDWPEKGAAVLAIGCHEISPPVSGKTGA